MDLSTAIPIMLVLMCLTAFASCSEMAIASCSRIRMKAKAESGDKKAKQILELLNNSERTITSIVVLNNIVNILLPTISTIVFTKLMPVYGVLVSTVLMTIILLIFGEIVPKVYGRENAEKYLMSMIGTISFVVTIIYPIAIIFIKISEGINKLLKRKDHDEEADLIEVEDELLTMIEESSQEGKINESEEELLKNAIEFNEIRVEEILTPKRNMIMIEVNTPNEEIFTLLQKERYSRIPIFENDTDNIIGVLSEREFLTKYVDRKEFDIREMLREPLFIPDTQKISKLLPELQISKSHLAIVLDERATVQGLVTVEDIVEEIVGEIWDEHDDVIFESRKISDIEYEVVGEMTINDFNELFEIKDIESEQLESTIAGYVIEIAECIPDLGAVYEDDDFIYTVTEVVGNKLEKIIVKMKEVEQDEKK